jgi:hypothetical protein
VNVQHVMAPAAERDHNRRGHNNTTRAAIVRFLMTINIATKMIALVFVVGFVAGFLFAAGV